MPEPHPQNSELERQPRILVVDDDPTSRELYTAFLTHRGYQVDTADDGTTALQLLSQEGPRPNVILIDLNMPQMTGPEFIQKCRTHQDNTIKTIPIIMHSSANFPPIIIEQLAQTPNVTLATKSDIHATMDLIREILDQQQSTPPNS